ncbi:MAG: hypothetical protein ACEQSB_03415 [Undibacterium sp.]
MRKKIIVGVIGMFVPHLVSAGPITNAQPIIVPLTNILNFLLSIVGVVAIIGLVIAGGMYFFAAGDMRQISLAKKMSLASITGIIIALGSYVVLKLIASFLA